MNFVHIDGDSFFASVEQALDPALRGRPVVTGMERGIASAMSSEAKALGIIRGMPIRYIRRRYPAVRIRASDYRIYTIFSRRMTAIAKRFCQEIEEYSIDEFFLRFPEDEEPATVEQKVRDIKYAIQRELGLTVSAGLAPTKVLAKAASSWQKPDGLVSWLGRDLQPFLNRLPLEQVWGIGSAGSLSLARLGVKTAAELVDRPDDWVQANTSKPYREIYLELGGQSVIPFKTERTRSRRSIRSSRSRPATEKLEVLERELSRHTEQVCRRLRSEDLAAGSASIFLKSQDFQYFQTEVVLAVASDSPSYMLRSLLPALGGVYRSGRRYRTVGVVLGRLVSRSEEYQPDLFGERVRERSRDDPLHQVLDRITERFGSGTVRLASSLEPPAEADRSIRRPELFYLPVMGEVE